MSICCNYSESDLFNSCKFTLHMSRAEKKYITIEIEIIPVHLLFKNYSYTYAFWGSKVTLTDTSRI